MGWSYRRHDSDNGTRCCWQCALLDLQVDYCIRNDLNVQIRKKKYAIVIVRSVSKSRRKPRKTSAEPSSNKSLCKSNSPQDFDPTLQRLETNRMSEELHVQFQVQVFKTRLHCIISFVWLPWKLVRDQKSWAFRTWQITNRVLLTKYPSDSPRNK